MESSGQNYCGGFGRAGLRWVDDDFVLLPDLSPDHAPFAFCLTDSEANATRTVKVIKLDCHSA